MKQQKPLVYGISVVCCVLLLTVTTLVAPTWARYENLDCWKSVYSPEIQNVSSNYLTIEGQTILLQPWKITAGSSRAEDILLITNTGTVTGTVRCSTDSPYITAQMEQEPFQIGTGGYITTLKLSATEAVVQLSQQTDVSVTVTFTTQQDRSQIPVDLKADFRVTLLPQTEEPQPESQSTVAYVEVEQNAEELAFAWSEKLVFSVAVHGSADMLELMYNGDSFPKGTRYCVGQETFVLCDPMTIKLPVTGTSVSAWLDFSQTDKTQPQTVSITATAYLDGTVTGEDSFTVPVSRAALTLDSVTKPVIAGGGTLSVPMTGDDTGLSWKLEHLSYTEAGIAYISQEDNFFLTVRIQQTQLSDGTKRQTLKISNEAGLAPAGTYRLTLTRQDMSEIIGTCQLDFFIHY